MTSSFRQTMKKTSSTALIGLLLTCLGGGATAQTLVDVGKVVAAKGAGGAAACVSCHGTNGEGNAGAGFPRLAGLSANYLEKQLDDIASDARPSALMGPVAKLLSEGDRRAVSQYYASLPPPYNVALIAATAAADPAENNRGAWLAIRGAWEKDLPACNQCHGPGGIGVGAAFPALAGQPKQYLSAQLQAWQTGKRSPFPLGLMPSVATKMTVEDIDAVATYYSELPQSANSSAGQTK